MTNKEPFVEISHPVKACWEGWGLIGEELKKAVATLGKKVVIAVECYQGTYLDINLSALKRELAPRTVCQTKDIFRDERDVRALVNKTLDFKSGSVRFSTNCIKDYLEPEKLGSIRKNIGMVQEGIILIYGTGASQITEVDLTVYLDMSRSEILQRFRRNDISNLGVSNQEDDFDRQYKWGYFMDWRICDKIKKQLIGDCDYFLETNNWQKPKLAKGDVVRKGFKQASQQPIFMAPFFDPELWDQRSIKNLKQEDFVLGFNCDIEEDNVLLQISNSLFEIPAINLVYHQGPNLLGASIYKKFGSDVPLKVNYVNAMENGNHLILGIYPSSDSIMEQHGLRYQQTENYYIMDVKGKARMYVDVKSEVSVASFKKALETKKKKEVSILLNPVNLDRHDHLSIPQETIHSNGHQVIMLHISTAPQVFKSLLFKDMASETTLSDHNIELIQNTINTGNKGITKNNIKILPGKSSDIQEELLTPQENSQISISRFWFREELALESNEVFNMFNLIEGSEITIEGRSHEFKPFAVNYGETFFMPAGVGKYTVKSSGNKRIGLLRIIPTC